MIFNYPTILFKMVQLSDALISHMQIAIQTVQV